ncbi:AraC family transcriptional regulator [Aquabacterium sp.]|uniref:AraC family transcriptional regulator n=1 Tax=Aquabacterium sp. TaxID=1872578 RepID=UPI002C6DFA4A|nr:AraC family transcriptional regulator [Aquabacterium sp.]HSW04051.1 AraC family transcriptional regulator [Aquabacterium sp.]
MPMQASPSTPTAPHVRLVRAASLTGYVEVARSLGLDPLRMLADAGLSPGMLKDPDIKVPADRVNLLLERSAQASGVESFALRMAESRQLSNFGAVGLVVRDQPTLRESVEVLIRYHAALNGSLAMVLEESGEVVVIREEVTVGSAQPVRQSTELAIGVLLRAMRRFLGEHWVPRLVCFTHAAPRELATHYRVFGPRVEFDQEFNAIVCSRAELDAPNPSADPLMARYALRLLELTPEDAQERSLLDDVRRTAMLLLPSGRCSIEQVASHLGIVCRTVQRRLADQGLSFSTVVNELRVELAARYVLHSARPLTEVAALLGFAAPSGFSRWYQGQFGCSPSQSRSSAKSEAVTGAPPG